MSNINTIVKLVKNDPGTVMLAHQILLEKLCMYGIRGTTHSWFKSYLSDRTQKVCFNGELSENVCKMECGVPQGSILAPLLYLIFRTFGR